jgi:hypothetical protein
MTYTIGQKVNYSNGNPSVYTGQIVDIKDNGKQLVIVDDAAALQLWNAGFAVGSCISPNQIINEK